MGRLGRLDCLPPRLVVSGQYGGSLQFRNLCWGRAMEPTGIKRTLAAIVMADVVGHSSLMQQENGVGANSRPI